MNVEYVSPIMKAMKKFSKAQVGKLEERIAAKEKELAVLKHMLAKKLARDTI